MAKVIWVGLAEALADIQRVTVTTFTAGTVLTVTVNSRNVSYTCITGDTAASAVAGLIAAFGSSNDARTREITAVADNGDSTKFFLVGPANGTPLFSPSVGSGLSIASYQTGTGPNHANNVANYSTGALPSAADTLVFSGLTTTDGPQHALTALSAIALDVVEVRSDYQGSIGLPDVNVNGYVEFRTKYLTTNSPIITVSGNANETAQRLRFFCTVTNTTVRATGLASPAPGFYPLNFYGCGAGSSLFINNYGASVCPGFGQTATLATVDAVGSSVALNSGTTAPACTFRGSQVLIDCIVTALTFLDNTTAVVLPGTTTTGSLAFNCVGSQVDWRSVVAPASTVNVGINGTLNVNNVAGTIAAFTLVMDAGATFNDPTGNMTTTFEVQFPRCRPSDCQLILKQATKFTVDTL